MSGGGNSGKSMWGMICMTGLVSGVNLRKHIQDR